MHCGDDDSSPPYITTYHDGPYNLSLASSASSSSASVWSDASSQLSDDSSVHSAGTSSDLEISDSYCCTSRPSYLPLQNVSEHDVTPSSYWPKSVLTNVAPPEQRHNPRRTSAVAGGRSGCPPSLVRQCDRKVNFVDSLVGKLTKKKSKSQDNLLSPLLDSSAQIVEAIWPLSSVVCRSEVGSKGVLPLRTFIQETLRRSRTSYSTLQVALYYLILIKPHVPKHDFTMEQPEDAYSTRALQCGRRMFLSALILASKYLQDRNYSARAWSKISGLNTQEINHNEMAFLLAVNWQLHITDAVFQRWTDIVLKYTPTQPPSPGAVSSRSTAEASAGWKAIILHLNPELDNVEGVSSSNPAKLATQCINLSSTKPFVEQAFCFETESSESTPTPRYYTPQVMEPSPSVNYPSSKPAPAFGLLPTPRLTPQNVGFNTPAVSAVSYMLGKSAMGLAIAQATSVCSVQSTDKWTTLASPSPVFTMPRRSSLARSLSTVSSPESMVSDTSSRSSRSSSISSASSLMSAPVSSKLDVQARCRYAKQCCERIRTKALKLSEIDGEDGPTSSPESYTGPVGRDLLGLSLVTHFGKRDGDFDYMSHDSANDAARALQELHNYPRSNENPVTGRAGAKRCRPISIDNSLQDNVRDILASQIHNNETSWSDCFVRRRFGGRSTSSENMRSALRGEDGRKRVCCSTEASTGYPKSELLTRPGMWEGILN